MSTKLELVPAIPADTTKARILTNIQVAPTASLLEAMAAIESGVQGIAFVADKQGMVLGSVTDGDIRRAALAGESLSACCLPRIMNKKFVFVGRETSRAEVLDLMRAREINGIPILDERRRLIGLHLLRELVGREPRPNWALIMAGGKGTRLRPLTENIPKPLIAVAGRPILERIILHLVGNGIQRIFLSVNYMAEKIEDYFGDGSSLGCKIEYVREEAPLGTGGSLRLLPTTPTHPMIVMNGDLITQFDVGQMLSFHSNGGYAATVGVRPYEAHVPFGVTDTDGDRLTAIREKPVIQMLVNAGIYVISPRLLDLVPAEGEVPITDLFARALSSDLPVGAHLINDEWIDVGRHDELNRARGRE